MTKSKVWTKDEDQYVRDNYMTKTYFSIAVALHRTLGSICTRVSALNLKKTTRAFNEPINNRIGTIVRPQEGVLIHYGMFRDDNR